MKRSLLTIWTLLFFVGQLPLAMPNDVLPRVLESVVMIIAMDENLQPLGIGSGFVISKDGKIATNYHIIEGASSAIVKFVNREESYKTTSLVHKNPERDLAVIKINTIGPMVSLGDDEITRIGQKIYAIGNPEGLEGTVSQGIISGFRKISDDFRLMQITAPISPGSSGGPLITEAGDVIGVASASLISGQNLNFAIPVKELKHLLQQAPLDAPFNKQNVPLYEKQRFSSNFVATDLVRITKFRGGYGYGGNILMSITNGLTRDIRNIKVLVIWKSKEGQELHYSPLLMAERVASRHTKQVSKFVQEVGSLPSGTVPIARIIDYEILPTSGSLEFK